MVRAIVGTLVEVGLNKLSEAAFLEVLAKQNRSLAGTSAPAKGLYLTQVNYPESIYIHG
jgi:tRNA pseudouridine38-40 synthase